MNKRPSKLRLEHLRELTPLTKNQKEVFDCFSKGNHLCLDGSAGTGKTFISLYLALESVLKKEYSKVIIVRSALPTRDMGFLPGTLEEKEEAYKTPYKAIVNDLFEDHEAWNKLLQSKQIEFLTTSFIRGLTIKNAIVIVDESQNCNYHELCSVITRLGDNCRFIMCGDYYQSDFTRNGDKDGIKQFMVIVDHMKYFEHIEFGWEDIVRSDFVRDFIMTKELYEHGKL